MSTRCPPWEISIGCPRCHDDDPDVACDCPCHNEDQDEEDQ